MTIERSLGAYDHFYEDSDVPDSGGKHDIAHAFVVSASDCAVVGDDQHSELRIFEAPPHGSPMILWILIAADSI